MNSTEIDNIIKKNPRLASKREGLEKMRDGAFCMHNSWGFGEIVSYDATSGKLTINFEGKAGHLMDPVFCVDKLEILEDDNILVRCRKDSENLQKEMQNGGAFVVNYIRRNKIDCAASVIELENIFKQVFGFKPVNNTGLSEKIFKQPIRKLKRNTESGGTKQRKNS